MSKKPWLSCFILTAFGLFAIWGKLNASCLIMPTIRRARVRDSHKDQTARHIPGPAADHILGVKNILDAL